MDLLARQRRTQTLVQDAPTKLSRNRFTLRYRTWISHTISSPNPQVAWPFQASSEPVRSKNSRDIFSGFRPLPLETKTFLSRERRAEVLARR
jgi:hypothetical protein